MGCDIVDSNTLIIDCSVLIYPEYQKQGIFGNFLRYAQTKFKQIIITGVSSFVMDGYLRRLGWTCQGGDFVWTLDPLPNKYISRYTLTLGT